MDGYLSKPIRPDALYAAIEAVLPAPHAPAGAVVDWPAALERVQGRAAHLLPMIELFEEECAQLLPELQPAARHVAADAVAAHARAAHRLQGSAACFGARPAAGAALRLEQLARAGDLAQAEPACAALEAEIGRLLPVLAAYAQQRSS